MFIVYPNVESSIYNHRYKYENWVKDVRGKLGQDNIRTVPIEMKEFQELFKDFK